MRFYLINMDSMKGREYCFFGGTYMNKIYWNIDPDELIKKNPDYNRVAEGNEKNLPLIVANLMSLYRNKANECIELVKKINYENFEESMIKLFEKEAYLSEISYYLENIEFSEFERERERVLSRIEKEYLVDYYFKLGQAHDEGYFLVSLLKKLVLQQRFIRFGKQRALK